MNLMSWILPLFGLILSIAGIRGVFVKSEKGEDGASVSKPTSWAWLGYIVALGLAVATILNGIHTSTGEQQEHQELVKKLDEILEAVKED